MRTFANAIIIAFLGGAIWFGFQVSQPKAAETANAASQKWQYLVDPVESQFLKVDYLDKKGSQGWEYCGLVGGSAAWGAVFKRPKQ